MQARYYQTNAVNLTRSSIASGHKRPLVVLSTGAGKSIIIGTIISLASLKGATCIFLVHRRGLVTQFKETLSKHFNIESGTIMAGEEFVRGLNVYVGTVQTYSRRLKLGERFFVDADMLLCDEAHTTLSRTYLEIFNHYKDKVIIGTTATPMRSDQRGLGEVYDDLIDVIGTRELTDGGFLAPVKYYVPATIDLAKIKLQCGDYQNKELAKRVDTPRLVGDVVENWLKYAYGRKTIVFAVNVKHSMHLRDEFNKIGIPAYHLDAKSPDEERDAVFGDMDNGKIKVVCNVGLYVEGIDVPDISCVVMARPTKSLGLYRQCAGRGMRISKDADDMILLDHGGVVEEHGLLTDEIEWSLDGEDRAWKKAEPKEKEKKQTICRSCKQVFEGASICPDCGTPLKSFGKAITTVDATLRAVDGTKDKKIKYTMADKRIYYGMMLHYTRSKGWSDGAAAHKYKEKFGVWPKGFKGMSAIVPDAKFLSYQKHLMIKFAKSKQKKVA